MYDVVNILVYLCIGLCILLPESMFLYLAFAYDYTVLKVFIRSILRFDQRFLPFS